MMGEANGAVRVGRWWARLLGTGRRAGQPIAAAQLRMQRYVVVEVCQQRNRPNVVHDGGPGGREEQAAREVGRKGSDAMGRPAGVVLLEPTGSSGTGTCRVALGCVRIGAQKIDSRARVTRSGGGFGLTDLPSIVGWESLHTGEWEHRSACGPPVKPYWGSFRLGAKNGRADVALHPLDGHHPVPCPPLPSIVPFRAFCSSTPTSSVDTSFITLCTYPVYVQ